MAAVKPFLAGLVVRSRAAAWLAGGVSVAGFAAAWVLAASNRDWSDLTAYTAHSNVPEAIYPADYGYSDYATTPLQCIPNNAWDHNQRVHQWSGDTALRIRSGDSAPGWTIDEDCLDGPAQGLSSYDDDCT